jgi:hypothetical protein
LDVFFPGAILAQHLSQRENVFREIAFLHKGVGPHLFHQLVFLHQTPGVLKQNQERFNRLWS